MVDVPAAEEPYQSLYRRYRPQRFGEVRGQEHVTRALRNAVRDGKVAHAYLFSGPRGTGKTSTARILAMALNCAHPDDGEPDGTCDSCVAIRRGSSLDVQELDAASNRGIDEMRDLLSRVALGIPGRWKVYIVDEVHQLTPVAASALLKTLEEPPPHVVFVLATTDPQKVLQTIRSRTQHFELRLLGSETLAGLVREVNEAAGLGVAPEAIDLVVRRGHGSARDALSALDQVAALGEVGDDAGPVSEIVDALAERDPVRVLAAVAEAVGSGRDPRQLLSDLLEQLRNGFLAEQAPTLVMLSDDAASEAARQARSLGRAGVEIG
ncbi:MAG: DNA polymerase III subunit gamma/tau, partial [Actinomycetota bacterium]|nr:DNA polymerase III subunit gamma/tau [Actinomycetota bacterium]